MSDKCPVCRAGRATIEHLVTHTPKTLAEELIKARSYAAKMQSRLDSVHRCGKIGYETEDKALRALLNTWAASDRNPQRQECRAYLCPQCNRWHLTSKPAIAS